MEPLWLETLRHEHAPTYPARGHQSFWRIWALVQKVKIHRLGLSLHVADLPGVRNLKRMGRVEFQVVKWLQAFDHQTWIAARRATSPPTLPNAFILPGLHSLSWARIKEAAHLP
jgi:hypothetical protein